MPFPTQTLEHRMEKHARIYFIPFKAVLYLQFHPLWSKCSKKEFDCLFFLKFRYCPSRFPLMLPMQTVLEEHMVWACLYQTWAMSKEGNWWVPDGSVVFSVCGAAPIGESQGGSGVSLKRVQGRCFALVIHRLPEINVPNLRWKAETLLKAECSWFSLL